MGVSTQDKDTTERSLGPRLSVCLFSVAIVLGDTQGWTRSLWVPSVRGVHVSDSSRRVKTQPSPPPSPSSEMDVLVESWDSDASSSNGDFVG